MTYNEYCNLVEEYSETDSLSRRKEIKKKVFDVCVALFNRLEKLYNRYDSSFIDDSEYHKDSGYFSFNEFDECSAYLNYEDHWKYGGECCIGVTLNMAMLEPKNRISKARDLEKEYVSNLKFSYESNKKNIKRLEDENQVILDKLARFGYGDKRSLHHLSESYQKAVEAEMKRYGRSREEAEAVVDSWTIF